MAFTLAVLPCMEVCRNKSVTNCHSVDVISGQARCHDKVGQICKVSGYFTFVLNRTTVYEKCKIRNNLGILPINSELAFLSLNQYTEATHSFVNLRRILHLL